MQAGAPTGPRETGVVASVKDNYGFIRCDTFLRGGAAAGVCVCMPVFTNCLQTKDSMWKLQ